MKKILVSIIATFLFLGATAQVKVGNNPTTINSSAVLEAESTTKGFLPPRMTQAQMNAVSNPAEGLVIYCTDCVPKGLYVNTSSPTPLWLSSSNPGTGSISALDCGGATISQYLISGKSSSGSSISVPYSGGNGGSYLAQTVVSTGVTGITATLSPGNFASTGVLIYSLSGTPATTGTASFSFNIGGQSCTFSTTVNSGTITSITNSGSPAIDYHIQVNANTSYLAGPLSNGTVAGTDLVINTGFTVSASKWNFVDAGAGQYAIFNPNSNLVAEVENGVANNLVAFQIYTSNETAATDVNQRFTLQAVSGSIFNGGTIAIHPAQNTSKSWDIDGGIIANNTRIHVYNSNTGHFAQTFKLLESQTLTNGVAVSNYGVAFGYLGGNSGTYPAQSIASTGVTGLTATLAAGSFNNGSALGFLRYIVSGTPSGSGTATFSAYIGGQSITFSLTVN